MPENDKGSVPPAPPAASPAKADSTAEILAALKDLGIADLKAQVAALAAKVEASAKAPAKVAGAEAVPAVNAAAEAPAPRDFMAMAKAYAAEKSVSMVEAMKAIDRANPGMHGDWVAASRTSKVRRS